MRTSPIGTLHDTVTFLYFKHKKLISKKGEAKFHKTSLEHRESSVSAVSVIKCQVTEKQTHTHTQTSGNPQPDKHSN